MNFETREVDANGIKFIAKKDGKSIGRTYLYLMNNDLHEEPFGLLEDVWIEESYRGQGIGTELVKEVIERAEEVGCYKLICTSRHTKPEVQEWYKSLGFKDHGLEFRIDY